MFCVLPLLVGLSNKRSKIQAPTAFILDTSKENRSKMWFDTDNVTTVLKQADLEEYKQRVGRNSPTPMDAMRYGQLAMVCGC